MSRPTEYAEILARLAALDAAAAADRAEAQRWYAERVAAADAAVAEAQRRVADGDDEIRRAERELHRLQGRAETLWIEYLHHVGPRAERFGAKLPDPALPRQRGSTAPEDHLGEVEAALAETPTARPLAGGGGPLFLFLGALGGGLAFAASEGLRWAARESGGDLAAGSPVLALIVLVLLGPLLGFVPARLVADRRHVPLELGAIARVVLAALVTAGLLVTATQ